MNERILELAKQAGAHWNHGDFNMGSSVEFQEDDLEKFVESIFIEVFSTVYRSDIKEGKQEKLVIELAHKFGLDK